MLYHWIEKYPEYLSKPHVRHYKQATAELKEQAIRHYASYGKVEMLRGDFAGFASVRIDKKNRIIF